MNPSVSGEFAFDVFVSYSRADRDVVEHLVKRLKDGGFSVWWDIEQMAGGSIVLGQLADGIVRSAHMIACLSDSYIDRDFTAYELQTNHWLDPANKQNRTIPVKIRALTRDIPAQIQAFVTCDLTDGTSYDAEYARMIALIGRGTPTPATQESRDSLQAKYQAAIDAKGDPILMLFRARIAAESFARFLCHKLVGPPPFGSTLDVLVDSLHAAHKLPPAIDISLGTVQTYGNLIVQKSTDVLSVTQSAIQPGLAALRVLADWMFQTYFEKNTPKNVWDSIWDELPEGTSTDDRVIPGSQLTIRQGRTSTSDLEAVYQGHHMISRQPLEVRLAIANADDKRDQFFEEISKYARVDGPGILRVVTAGTATVNGRPVCVYVALEQVDGPSAEDLVKRFGALPALAAAELASGIAGALETLHGVDPPIAHGAVTPENVLIDRYGNVKLRCIGRHQATATTADPPTDVRMLQSAIVTVLGQNGDGDIDDPRSLAGAIGQCHAAADARAVATTFAHAAHAGISLRTVVTHYREKRPLPDRLTPVSVAGPVSAAVRPLAFGQMSETPVDAIGAWPLGEGLILVLERAGNTLAIFQGAELKWRDATPMQFRVVATGSGNRVAIGGWDGKLAWAAHDGVVSQTPLWGTIGAIVDAGGEWVAGTWRNALMRVGAIGGPAAIPPLVQNGVLRIAVVGDGARFAIADLSGAVFLYSQGRRVAATAAAFAGLQSIAFCGRHLLVLAGGILTTIDWEGRIQGTDRPPNSASVTLFAQRDGQRCLLVADDGQSWLVDENGAYIPHRRLAPPRAIRSCDSAMRHMTVAHEPGGCAYWRQDEQPATIWPDALSAQVSNDGHFVAVRSADRVALYFDPD